MLLSLNISLAALYLRTNRMDLDKSILYFFCFIVCGNFYFIIQDMVKYSNRAWKKMFFFLLRFIEILINGWNYFDEKNWAKQWHRSTKTALISGNRKNYIFQENNCFVKMSVSLLVCYSERYQIFVDELAQKLVWISKPNFTCIFGALRLRAD